MQRGLKGSPSGQQKRLTEAKPKRAWKMGRGGAKMFQSGDIVAVLQRTNTIEQAGQLLDCSPSVIWNRAQSNASVLQAIRSQARERERLLAEAIIKHRGILSKVAQELGMDSPVSVRYHILRCPRLKDVYLESRQGMVDTAEDNIFRAVEAGHLGYSWKLLQTLGKDRGYTERREIDSVQVHVTAAPTQRLVELLDQHAERDPVDVETALAQLPETDRELLGRALRRHWKDETSTEAVEGELVENNLPASATLYQDVTEP